MKLFNLLLAILRLQDSDHYGDSGDGDYDPLA